jgi:glycosyltransferase involved in cell wall biosynthesis
MKNEIVFNALYDNDMNQRVLIDTEEPTQAGIISEIKKQKQYLNKTNDLPEILFITSYPPRVCGIATYSQDLIKALDNKFSHSLSIKVCALESEPGNYQYPGEVKYVLKSSIAAEYVKLASTINKDNDIKIVLIQHEFGFFSKQEQSFLEFLYELSKPVIIVFHTVLPHPDEKLKSKIRCIAAVCGSIIVMTHNSANILTNDYGLSQHKISVITHGTHLVQHVNKNYLKIKYGLKGRKVLTTFGLLSSGKSIETTIEALPDIVKKSPEAVFLIIGKTHPEVLKTEGEKYREKLEQKVRQYELQKHVIFINNFLTLPVLLEYLQLTDVYLFTTNDPNQAVSGTFSYAMSCACPIISTPIPHAKEVLTEDTGIIIDFLNSKQLSDGVNQLLSDDSLRRNMSTNTLQKIVSTAWENAAVAHALLFEKMSNGTITIQYNLPVINLAHLKQMTINNGIIQFSKINQPDISSGYTLDDNARAFIAICMHYKLTDDEKDLEYIRKYFRFLKHCLQQDGDFINYVDKDNNFTSQNEAVNLEDANGRAIWALGYAVSLMGMLPYEIVSEAITILEKSLLRIGTMHSTRAMAFAIKGIYYYLSAVKSPKSLIHIRTFANRMVQMYRHESVPTWEWFEGYLTYANSILPEAMLYAWILTGETVYKEIAVSSFNFLLSQTFNENGIEVISNKKWLQRGQKAGHFGEQPIDVAYTVMALDQFYTVFGNEDYLLKMKTAFNWFLGNNRLHQIIYNPCTGGCYDGLEESHANLNQGAESTVSYLMARLTIEKYKND